jgi:hypothetical protein
MNMAKVEAKTLISPDERLRYYAKILAAFGIIMLLAILPTQMVSGPLVNATLFIVCVLISRRSAILIALVPSPIALLSGVLPFVLAPMIPFIMLGNILMIYGFDYLYKKNFWYGVGLGAFIKFVFLYATSQLMIHYFLTGSVPIKIAVMMSWPQLFTALLGGILAYFFLKTIKKYDHHY